MLDAHSLRFLTTPTGPNLPAPTDARSFVFFLLPSLFFVQWFLLFWYERDLTCVCGWCLYHWFLPVAFASGQWWRLSFFSSVGSFLSSAGSFFSSVGSFMLFFKLDSGFLFYTPSSETRLKGNNGR